MTLTKQQQVEQLDAARHAYNATGEMLFNGDIHPSIIILALLRETAMIAGHFFKQPADASLVRQLASNLEHVREVDAAKKEAAATA